MSRLSLGNGLPGDEESKAEADGGEQGQCCDHSRHTVECHQCENGENPRLRQGPTASHAEPDLSEQVQNEAPTQRGSRNRLEDFIGVGERHLDPQTERRSLRRSSADGDTSTRHAPPLPGRPEEAEAKRSEARATIDEIAELFQDVDLKEKFVASANAKLG